MSIQQQAVSRQEQCGMGRFSVLCASLDLSGKDCVVSHLIGLDFWGSRLERKKEVPFFRVGYLDSLYLCRLSCAGREEPVSSHF